MDEVMEEKEVNVMPNLTQDSMQGNSEPDYGPEKEMNQGDGANLTRPSQDGNALAAKTADALKILGAGKSYGCNH